MSMYTMEAIILFVSFIVLLVLRVPVTFSLLGSAVISCLVFDPKFISSVFLRLGDGIQSFSFLAIPFFIFAGDIMSAGGISEKIVNVADGRSCIYECHRLDILRRNLRFSYSRRLIPWTDPVRHDDKKRL